MPALLLENARLLTLAGGPGPRRGADLGDLGAIPQGAVLIDDGLVQDVGETVDVPASARRIDLQGRVVMPAFVDAHTHACFAGVRLDEWEAKLAGAAYLDIMKAGGGILATVRATREASEAELADLLRTRLLRMLQHGTTTVEVKSGYGLSTGSELKMLRAIRAASVGAEDHVVATACIGHMIDRDVPDFVHRTIAETLPAVHEAFPGVAIDAYCEEGSWSVAETVRLGEAACELGHPLRLHVDQFHALGMLDEAIRLGARSVDHLEASTPEGLERLAESDTFGVMLPASGFHTDDRYADGRRFVDAGGALVVASNFNPGSAPILSMPFVLGLAVRKLGLRPAEAIAAATVNAAALLGLDDRGRLEPGCRADLLVLDASDEREVLQEAGSNFAYRVLTSSVAFSRS